MIKRTVTKSGMQIVTVKAAGLYVNVSFGKAKARKAARPAARPIFIDYFGAASCAVLALSAALPYLINLAP